MDIQTFIKVVTSLPSDISVLAKGPTGIGKSHIFHSIGKTLDLPVIDRRLSQMTEGDIIGLPELIDGVTRFAPVDWLVNACKNPVVLFFDELNRATLEVQQCAFQIVLDRELNGHKLHPETRVYAAINEGSEYQVLDMDPALLRRFWTMALEPTVEDWLMWASQRNDISKIMQAFVKNYPNFLRHTGELEPGKVYPNPASWHRLSTSLSYSNMNPDDYVNKNLPEIFYPMCKGFIGDEASIKFVDFIREYELKFSADDVLNHWAEKEIDILALNEDKKNDLIEQIMTHLRDENNELTMSQIDNVSNFIKKCPDEMIVNFFNLIMETKQVSMIRKFHKHLGRLVTEIVNASNKF